MLPAGAMISGRRGSLSCVRLAGRPAVHRERPRSRCPHRARGAAPMRIVISEFMSLDGVVQAPGGPEEDTDGGFAHGGWSHPFFDPEVVGGAFAEGLAGASALLFGRRTWQTMAAAWPGRAGDPFADQM